MTKLICLHISHVEKFLHMTDFFLHFSTWQIYMIFIWLYLPCGNISTTDNLSCVEFLYVKIYCVENFSTWQIFSTGTVSGACDKYQVCSNAAQSPDLKLYFGHEPHCLCFDRCSPGGELTKLDGLAAGQWQKAQESLWWDPPLPYDWLFGFHPPWKLGLSLHRHIFTYNC